MDNLPFFRLLNRINAVLLLFLLLAGLALVAFIFIEMNPPKTTGGVVVNETTEEPSVDIPEPRLVLGAIRDIQGHNVQYVALETERSGGKFSSGYSGGETRNILFLAGDEWVTRWLFPNHQNFVEDISVLQDSPCCDQKSKAVAILYETKPTDTNNNGMLDRNDLSQLSLSKPDGSNHSVIAENIERILQHRVQDNGKTLLVLTQNGSTVSLAQYSLQTFQLTQQRTLLEL